MTSIAGASAICSVDGRFDAETPPSCITFADAAAAATDISAKYLQEKTWHRIETSFSMRPAIFHQPSTNH
jgi:hypothetical protein